MNYNDIKKLEPNRYGGMEAAENGRFTRTRDLLTVISERDQWKEMFDRAMDDESSLREQLREAKAEIERLNEYAEDLIKDYAEWMSPEDYIENTQRYEAQVKFLQAENAALLAYPYQQMMARIRHTATEAALRWAYCHPVDAANNDMDWFAQRGLKAVCGDS